MELSLNSFTYAVLSKYFEGNFGIKKSFHSFAPSISKENVEVKEYIVVEADKLFCQYGFKSVTMDDIAKHLGMSKKTIYQHFSDKDELVSLLIKDKLSTQDCAMREDYLNAENAVHEIFLAMEKINLLLTGMNPKLFYDLQKYHPEAWVTFKTFKEKTMTGVIRSNMERGVKEGFYRPEIEIDVLTQMRLEQADLLFNQPENYTQQKYTIAQVMIEITEHFLYGVCNEQGLALIKSYKEKLTPATQH